MKKSLGQLSPDVKKKMSMHLRFLLIATLGFLSMVVSITLLTCLPMYNIINEKFFNIGMLVISPIY